LGREFGCEAGFIVGYLFAQQRIFGVLLPDRWEQAETSYARMLAQFSKTPCQSSDAATRLAELVHNEVIAELRTKSECLFFIERSITHAGVLYRVFQSEKAATLREEPIGFCEIGRFADGICVILRAEVAAPFQRKGIATAVYDLITSDMARSGGLLWPVAPKKMSDAEFMVWWRRSPALVFYYPQRDRLGLPPRSEFEELFEDAMDRGIWTKTITYSRQLLSRFRRAAIGASGR
jgi:hypothetical protein